MSLVNLKSELKNTVVKTIRKMGYEIIRSKSNTPVNRAVELALYNSLYGQEMVKQKPFYNIGAGRFKHPAWQAVDYYSEHYEKYRDLIDINWDISTLTALPVKNESAQLVYTSHTIEHLTDEYDVHLFHEAYRILAKNGIFRITCPDIDLYYEAYKRSDKYFFPYPTLYGSYSIEQLFLSEFATQLSQSNTAGKPIIQDAELRKIFSELTLEDAFNYFTKQCNFEIQRKNVGNHINWWNYDKTYRFLQQVGFKRIRRSGYGQSMSPVLRDTAHFDNTWPRLSLYIEAEK